MKKIFSVLMMLVILLTIENLYPTATDASEISSSPHISIEIGDYEDDRSGGFISADTVRLGRDKTCATAGETIVVSFILSGISELEYFQLSGNYNKKLLTAGYYKNSKWFDGDYDQDFDTVIFDASDFYSFSFEDSLSFTRTNQSPLIYLCGYSTGGAVSLPEKTTLDFDCEVDGVILMSVGFRVIRDIENIYDAFSWDADATMVSTSMNNDYTLSSGLEISCLHLYEGTHCEAECEESGYECYDCIYCNSSYKNNFVDPIGHYYNLQNIQNNTEFIYSCSDCDQSLDLTGDELNSLWSADYINTCPERTSVNDSSLLDVVKDNIINAKDYALIYKGK